MNKITREVASDLKAKIFDLNVRSLKQALFGCVEILTQHPSVRIEVFKAILEDAERLQNWKE